LEVQTRVVTLHNLALDNGFKAAMTFLVENKTPIVGQDVIVRFSLSIKPIWKSLQCAQSKACFKSKYLAYLAGRGVFQGSGCEG
jgi:hypothetical protein